MNRRIVVSCTALAACVLFGSWVAADESKRDLRQSASEQTVLVSMIQLIATPERFEGRLVRVAGFCRLEFEGNALYLNREDYEAVLVTNGLLLDIAGTSLERNKSLSNRYVIVEGRFRARPVDSIGTFPGSIEHVSGIKPLPTRTQLRRGQQIWGHGLP